MPPTSVVLIVSAVIAGEALILLALRWWASSMFEQLSSRFPRRPPGRDARSRSYQSIRVGMMSFGFSFAIALDEHYAHFTPLRLGRVFGALPFSLPRALLAATPKGIGGYRTIRTGLSGVRAPEWLFEAPQDSR